MNPVVRLTFAVKSTLRGAVPEDGFRPILTLGGVEDGGGLVARLRFWSEAPRLEPGAGAPDLASKAWHPSRVVRARRRRVTLGQTPRSFTEDLFEPYASYGGGFTCTAPIRVSNPKCS